MTPARQEDDGVEPAVVLEESEHWAKVPEALAFDHDLSDRAVRVYIALYRRGQKPADCYPSNAYIADCIGGSARSVPRPLLELLERGWIRRFKRWNAQGLRAANGYEVVLSQATARRYAATFEKGAEPEPLRLGRLAAASAQESANGIEGSASAQDSADGPRNSARPARAEMRGEREPVEGEPGKESHGDSDSVGGARGGSPSELNDSTNNSLNGTARAANAKLDLGSASSAADAAAAPAPPSSVAPPAAGGEDERHPDVLRVIEHLGAAVARQVGRPVKTAAWDKPIGLLLRRGPTEWADPSPVPVETVMAVIDWTFGPGAVRDKSGFSWADQVRSGEALRRHWMKIQPLAEAGDRRLAPVPAGRRREDPSVQVEREVAELRQEWEAGEITPDKLFPRQARLAREAAERAARRSA